MRPSWEETRRAWAPDGGYRDIYVFETTADDWQRVVDLIRSKRWHARYAVDDEERPMPDDVREIFEARRDHSV